MHQDGAAMQHVSNNVTSDLQNAVLATVNNNLVTRLPGESIIGISIGTTCYIVIEST